MILFSSVLLYQKDPSPEMQIEPLCLQGAFRIQVKPHTDERGLFARTFCAQTFAQHGLETEFVQRSLSFNVRRGTLRGLHMQTAPHSETKIIRCTRGAVFDVIVDLRADSPTFGRWHAETLSAENRAMLYAPKGFAHGFQTLEDNSELYYEITPAYVPEAASGVRYDDPDLVIPWPVAEPVLLPRDSLLPLLRDRGSL